MVEEINKEPGPRPGIPAQSILVGHDRENNHVRVVVRFDSEEKLRTGQRDARGNGALTRNTLASPRKPGGLRNACNLKCSNDLPRTNSRALRGYCFSSRPRSGGPGAH